jgi:hypothetical protein
MYLLVKRGPSMSMIGAGIALLGMWIFVGMLSRREGARSDDSKWLLMLGFSFALLGTIYLGMVAAKDSESARNRADKAGAVSE